MLIEIWCSLIVICLVVTLVTGAVYDLDLPAAVSCGTLTLLLFGPSAILFVASWAFPGDGFLFTSIVGLVLTYGSGYWTWSHIRETQQFKRWNSKRTGLKEGRMFS